MALLDERRLDPQAALSPSDAAAIVGLLIAVTALAMALKPRLRGMSALLLVIAAHTRSRVLRGRAQLHDGLPWLGTHVHRDGDDRVRVPDDRRRAGRRQVFVDQRLRSRRPLGLLRILTPLESLESVLSQHPRRIALLTLAL